MITKEGIPFLGLKKFPHTGSYEGMRYYIKSLDKGESVTAFVYPEPYCFENTADEEKTSQAFPFTAEGMDELVEWLNQQYTGDVERWKSAKEMSWA
ncbi:hypothetical protein [Hespellia stercorisuis]|uniref:GNAT family acetyltransferase n=1 Tax=Hespellia stercorisuis DSM 15480 TaxID=1121950 RepID=A0A1M6QHH9_9FIRM|nr:hypothetical protein [Hespellia stercorisuis]SHK19774.1 hypothetical protein SAMN02745243_02432 [Hespellia stercorisuis DSM 15480]